MVIELENGEEIWYDNGMKILAIESSCDETAAAVISGPDSDELAGAGEKSGAGQGNSGANGGRPEILSNVVVSQVDIFAAYGGVIPEVAARSHLEAILPVVHKALDDARLTKDEIDYVAVTHAPGLLGSLLIGTLTARMLAILWKKPLYAVHHLKSHIYANWLHSSSSSAITSSDSPVLTRRTTKYASFRPSNLPNTNSKNTSLEKVIRSVPEFPLLALVISGGHTQIIYMREHNQFEIIGTTRDDAVGECFDKVAKILGLPYPGGPAIAQISTISSLSSPVRSHRMLNTAPLRASSSPRTSSKSASIAKADLTAKADSTVKADLTAKVDWYRERPNYKLPHPQVERLDFSFSGLKTAVLRAVQAELGVPINTPSYELASKLTEQQKADFAAAFQDTACEILLEKIERALEGHPEVKSLVLAGGVSANQVLREKAMVWAEEMCRSGKAGTDFQVYYPELKFAGDNAAMVGAAAYYEILAGVEPVDPYSLNILPRTPIK